MVQTVTYNLRPFRVSQRRLSNEVVDVIYLSKPSHRLSDRKSLMLKLPYQVLEEKLHPFIGTCRVVRNGDYPDYSRTHS